MKNLCVPIDKSDIVISINKSSYGPSSTEPPVSFSSFSFCTTPPASTTIGIASFTAASACRCSCSRHSTPKHKAVTGEPCGAVASGRAQEEPPSTERASGT